MQKTLKSNICFLIAAMIWGFAFVAQCDAADKINMFWLIAVRYFLGGLAIIPVILIFEKRGRLPFNKKTLIYGMICGTFLFTASSLQQWGINLDPNAGKAGFITGTYTVLVPIFYFLFFKKKTGANVLIGAIFALLGLYLLSFKSGISSISLSDAVIFIGALFWAGHIISIDKFVKDVSPIKLSCVQFFACSFLGLIFTVFNKDMSFAMAFTQLNDSLLPILYMGICSSGIAYTLQVIGQKGADPTYSAIILSTESVFAAAGGALFGIDEAMGARAYIGCAIIFIGIIFSQISFEDIKEKLKKA